MTNETFVLFLSLVPLFMVGVSLHFLLRLLLKKSNRRDKIGWLSIGLFPILALAAGALVILNVFTEADYASPAMGYLFIFGPIFAGFGYFPALLFCEGIYQLIHRKRTIE